MSTKAGRIRYMIESKGINQSKAASAAKIARSSMSLILSEKNNPSEQTVTLIAQYCGFDPYWAWTGDGEPRRLETAELAELTDSAEASQYLGQLLQDVDPDAADKICAYVRALPIQVTSFLLKSLIRWAHEMEAAEKLKDHKDPPAE